MWSCECGWIKTIIFGHLRLRWHVRPCLSEILVAHFTRLVAAYHRGMIHLPPRSSMSSSTWRVLSGYATYQRTPIRMTSGGKWTPLKLTAIVASLMMHLCSQERIIPQIASKKNCDTTPRPRGRESPGPGESDQRSALPLLTAAVQVASGPEECAERAPPAKLRASGMDAGGHWCYAASGEAWVGAPPSGMIFDMP